MPHLILALLLQIGPVVTDPDFLTVAEGSEFQATATHDEVIGLMARIIERSKIARAIRLGDSVEGLPIPLVIISDPPIRTAEAARASGRPIVFAFGNIHAGEVCGKEALLMLIRELGLGAEPELARRLVLVFCPILNADGNQPLRPDNRPGQLGPIAGMGRRPNAQGLDLNRDYIKLESPEIRALVRFLTEWDPHVTIDTHTTNGSLHRYTLTYDVPLHPAAHPAPIRLLREDMLPALSTRLRERTGYDSFFYGNFNDDHTVWATYSSQPRFGGPYQGLRGQLSILSEAYAYADYRDRVLCTRDFVLEALRYTAEHADEIRRVHQRARRETTARGADPQPDDVVPLRCRPAARPEPVIVKGYEPRDGDDDRPPTARDHRVVHLDRFEATLSVRRPWAYVIPAGLDAVVEKLAHHGIAHEPFQGAVLAETYTVRAIDRDERAFQGHHLVQLEVDAALEERRFEPGATLVRTAQPLGTLAVLLLEPQAEDGLAAWNFLDEHLAVGAPYPIVRVRAARDVAETSKRRNVEMSK